jgi:hypothetical protein
MADILALGISHYPPLSGHDARMATILRNMLRNPQLPAALREPTGWPAAARAEWGHDEGTTAAAAHRHTLVGWMRQVREALDDFRPDLVLLWGDDQYENFREDVVPPYCVFAHPQFSFGPRYADNVWQEPLDKCFTVQGHARAGKDLATALLRQGFDTAYSYKPLHHPLGHAFANAIFYLDYDRRGFPYPILPMSINCYGRKVIAQRGTQPRFDRQLGEADLDPPAPEPSRLFDLGAATARFFEQSPWRVALLASSGWSHAFLTAKNHFLWPDTASDRRLYDALRAGDYASWRAYPADAVEDCGQQEVLNWMCLAGALDALDRRPARTAFVDTWIFNSSKVFLIAPAS